MHPLHILHDPYLIAYVLLAYLCTVVTWPPKGWRPWVVVVCWVLMLLLVTLHLLR